MIKKIVLASVFFFALFTFFGSSWGAEAWIQEQDSSLYMSHLTTTIHIHIKNNRDHVQYFKISQQYFSTTPPIDWLIVNTNPKAVKMVKSVTPELGGDYGWRINPGETRSICFTLAATGPMGNIPTYIQQNGSMPNQFWPLIPEPGLAASWFMPNEIEYLNPDLDLQVWQSQFTFLLHNVDTKRVAGIVRAPIVPIDSKLTSSNPQITFVDKDVPWADTAAWDVSMAPGSSKWFTYTYQWPLSSSNEPSHSGRSYSSFPKTSASKNTTTVPTPGTGVPYGLLAIGAVVIAAGLTYSKFFR
ncbi:MAG: hypothetical protein Q8N08_04830 [Methanobacteriaceae archaeon]|nr:hypothetical protein [Methanobacteriaceae archaeon]